MLPSVHRLRHSTDFASAVRAGVRAGGASVVVHQQIGGAPDRAAPAQVGLIVGKGVGGSVVRHRVSRRLRAQIGQRLSALPEGSATVIRALPASATAPSLTLGRDLDRALTKLAARR